MTDRFEDILNDCTERLLQGESVEQCLQRYPEQSGQLEPLLRVVVAARRASAGVEPKPEFKAQVRHEVQSRLRARRPKAEPKRIPALRWVPRWAAVAACTALVFVFAASGTVAASSGSVPGDTLYPVKSASEQVQMKLTFSKAAKARLETRLAKRRVWETARLAEKGRTARLGAVAARFETHLAKMEQLAAEIEAADAEDGERVSELRAVLEANMARDLAVLDAAEAKAPWRYRNAVAVAKFRLIQEYGKAIDAMDELQNREATTSGSSGNGEAGAGDGGTGSANGSGGGTGDGGSAGSGQQGQTTATGFQVQARYAGSR